MNHILRFWILILSFTVGMGAFGYLGVTFATFISPEIAILTPDRDNQLVAAAVALGSLAVFIWMVLADGSTADTTPEQPETDDGYEDRF